MVRQKKKKKKKKKQKKHGVQTSFLVVLALGSGGMAKLQSILDRRRDHASPSYPHTPEVTRVRVLGPQVKEEEEEEEKEHQKTSKQTPRWRDETLPFDMPREYVVASEPGKNGILGTGTGDADADGNANENANTNVNAIFPPGIPLSASEILAFYPQHVIRQDVAERLVRNGYEARDVLGMIEVFHGGRAFGGIATSASTTAPSTTTTATATNTLHRVFTAALSSSQTAPPHTANPTTHPLNGTPPFPQNPNPNTNTNTDTNPPTVPTLSHLLTSLTHLPTSLAVRHLTTSLKWYAANKHTFTPPLDLNVLHTRALVQALCIPLRECGPQNVDAVVLAVWREGGGRVVGEELKSGVKLGGGGATGAAGVAFGGGARIGGEEGGELEKAGKSRVRINVPSGDVEADVVLRVGSVLLMPYFAVGGMVCVALEMGIGKAEGRRRERERGELVKDGSGGAGRISVAGNVADGGSEGEDEGDGEVGGGRDGDESGLSRVEESRGYVGSRKRARDGEDGENEEGEEEGI